MKKRLISIITTMAMLPGLIGVAPASAEPTANPVVFTKELIKAADSSAGIPDRIKLEAYVTGSTTSSSELIPADIVMVLDQSGSMDDQVNGQTKLSMMKQAVSGFVSQVASFNTNGDDTYRVAIVGFASETGDGNNTEILTTSGYETEIVYEAVAPADLNTSKTYYIAESNGYTSISYYAEASILGAAGWYTSGLFGMRDDNINIYSTTIYERKNVPTGEISTTQGVEYADLLPENYADALANCTDTSIAATEGTIYKAIDMLDGQGATRVDLGMQMASNIFAAQPEGTYLNRRRIVMVLTDGVPTTSNSFSETVANDSVSLAKSLKDEGVHIFSTYLGTPDANSVSFLQALSSNYPGATAYNALGTQAASSYYKAHADVTGITSFFEDIVYEISANSNLNESSVITDTISEYFKLPATLNGAPNPEQITAYTVEKTATGWADEEVPFETARITIGADNKTVKVDGFNFRFHCVTESAKDEAGTNFGRKLVIYIPIAEDETADTFGGYLPTNDGAAIYAKDGDTAPEITADNKYNDITIKYNLENGIYNRHIGTDTTYDFEYTSAVLNPLLDTMVPEGFIPDGSNNTGVTMEYRLIDTNLNADGTDNDDIPIATLSVPVGTSVDVTDFSNWTLSDPTNAKKTLNVLEGTNSAQAMYVLACRLTSVNSLEPDTLLEYSTLSVNVVNEDVHIVGGIIDDGGTIAADPADRGVILAGGYREEVTEGDNSATMIFTLKPGYEFEKIVEKTTTQTALDTLTTLYDITTGVNNVTFETDGTYRHQFIEVPSAETVEVFTRLKNFTLTTRSDVNSSIRESTTYPYDAENNLDVYFAAHNGYKITSVKIGETEETAVTYTEAQLLEGVAGIAVTTAAGYDGNNVIVGGDASVARTHNNYVEVTSEARQFNVTYYYYTKDGSSYVPHTDATETFTVAYGNPVTLPPEEKLPGTEISIEGDMYTLKGWFNTFTGTEFTGYTDVSELTMGTSNLVFYGFYEKNPNVSYTIEEVAKQIYNAQGIEEAYGEEVTFNIIASFNETKVGEGSITIGAEEAVGYTPINILLTDAQNDRYMAGNPIYLYEERGADSAWIYDDERYAVYYDGTVLDRNGEPVDFMMFENKQAPFVVNYDLNGGTIGGSSAIAPKIVDFGDSYLLPSELPEKSGYTFTGWKKDLINVTNAHTYESLVAGDRAVGAITLVAQYSGGGGGGGTPRTTKYTLTYVSNGGTEFDTERYNAGTLVELDKVPVKEGYIFDGWHLDEACTIDATEVKMTAHRTVYANWIEDNGSAGTGHKTPDGLNAEDHFAYVIGYTDGTVRPHDNITRAEVTSIFFRLITDELRNAYISQENTFTDVDAEMWYNTAISTMENMGIINGRSAGIFAADEFITRAEFAAICARFDNSEYTVTDTFTDVEGHWAADEIHEAAAHGWIRGYEDNTFRPDQFITRAEAMMMINRVLNRVPENKDSLLDDMTEWPDNSDTDSWYYLAVQEATNSHDYEMINNIYEKWTALQQGTDWKTYQ